MKFGQLLEYNKIFFFRIYAQIMVGRLVSDLFLFFRKTLWEVKQVLCHLVSIYSDSPQHGIKSMLYKT